MTDLRFQNLLDKVTSANIKYQSLLKEAEQEYLRRFGNLPSEVDDDNWIDIFHYNPIYTSVKDITSNADVHKK